MSVSKGISRIGQVFGRIAGVILGAFLGCLAFEYISRNYSFALGNGQNLHDVYTAVRSILILIGGTGGAAFAGYVLGGLPFFWIARTVNWVIEGFRE